MTDRLETERLILRLPELEDAETLAATINHPEIAKTTLMIPYPYTISDAEGYIINSRDPKTRESEHRFLIFLKDTGKLVGGIGLEGIKPRFKRAEIGYWCAVDHWGKGIVTEAMKRILKYAFEEVELNRVFTLCFAENFASARVMEKCGMKHEGTGREEIIKYDKPVDMHHYAILKSDWPPEEKVPIHMETERLILRTPKFSDLENMVEPINHPVISQFSAHIKYPFTIEDAHEWYKNQSWTENTYGHVTLLIFLKGSEELIGSIWFRAERHHKKASIAYWIGSKHWNKGYATEAVREMIRYGFTELGLERITAGIIVGNISSARVAGKIGMKLEGTAQKEWWEDDGQPIDCHHFVLYKEDWEKNS
ncbi:MAG: GNAT family N-acetyltransferase [bacterium]|nr:GNAT family N-acetyltransferase [bacterium]